MQWLCLGRCFQQETLWIQFVVGSSCFQQIASKSVASLVKSNKAGQRVADFRFRSAIKESICSKIIKPMRAYSEKVPNHCWECAAFWVVSVSFAIDIRGNIEMLREHDALLKGKKTLVISNVTGIRGLISIGLEAGLLFGYFVRPFQ